MSKRRKTKVFSFQGFNLAHYKATEAYTRAVSALFDKATDDIANAASRENYNPDKPFSFDDYPKAKAQLQKTIKGLAGKMQAVIETASRKQWLFACQKNDEFIASIFDTTKLTKGQLKKYQDRNLDALQVFQQRKVGGMDLSERVWKYTQQYREQIEVGLDVGLGEGRSAQQLSRDLRQNLKDPNRLFRRVRDKRGNLQLSKSAKAFHPGQGVYRSSYKNAMRLARSEINMSYRESDHLRWQQLDFVLGFEVHRSNREPKCNCELCERLVGRYPKWFKFKGWHPQCLCYAIPILEDFYSKERSDDRVARMRAALRGEEYKKYVSKGLINDLPDNFKEWASENEGRQKNWSSTPYFIKDNFVDGNLSKGLMYIQKSKSLTIQERAAIRHQQRTPEEAQDILKRWEERNLFIEAQKNTYEHWSEEEFGKMFYDVDITELEYKQTMFHYINDERKGYIQTYNSFDINNALRKGSKLEEDDAKTVATLDAIIARNRLPKNALLYRYEEGGFVDFLAGRRTNKTEWMSVIESFIGREIQDLGYRSTSVVEDKNIFEYQRDIKLIIKAKAGSNAYVTDNEMESEVVLPRGARIKILKVWKTFTHIIVESELV